MGPGKRFRLPDDVRVDVDRAVGELRVAFGHDAVVL
jgi:DNA polymerase-3 subunit alpha